MLERHILLCPRGIDRPCRRGREAQQLVAHAAANDPSALAAFAQARAQGKDVSVCGEMAGDVDFTRLLLGFGLRSFSMHPAQLLAVKQEVLRADTLRLAPWAQDVLASEDPAKLLG